MSAPTRPIAKLLIANRGEIARRVIRTCCELGIATVAVFSEADAEAAFVREADESVALGASAPGASYLRRDAIVAAALLTGADAVHPGYGFLAENSRFASDCVNAGLTFVGPSAEAIRAMASKIEARALMERAGVPVVPGATFGETAGADMTRIARRLGTPLLVKASAGGGGRGIRIVDRPADLPRAIEAARLEAASAFGDDTVFVERYLANTRHIEVQIVGDAHGCITHLFERECSIQRRHQKIIEESPSVAVDPAVRARLIELSVTAGKALHYVGLGTVEFLLGAEGQLYFLEVNTRLQVEHPVTEMVTGLDLVELQLRIAEGRRLEPRALRAMIDGHAIEARVYAEDPAAQFLPSPGRLNRLSVRPAGAVRIDAGPEDGGTVPPDYDPIVAKVIAHAGTRSEAARLLASALRSAEIHGVKTNRDLLVRVLESRAFLAGDTDTRFLERHDLATLAAPLVAGADERLHAVAAALALQAGARASAGALGTLPSGWRNGAPVPQRRELRASDRTLRVAYTLSRGRCETEVDGEPLDGCRLHGCTAETVDLEVDGVRRRYVVAVYGDAVYVNSAIGQCRFQQVSRFSLPETRRARGSLLSPVPGRVTQVLRDEGDAVIEGEALIVIESMKVHHELVATTSGVLARLLTHEGAQIQAGAAVAVIQEEPDIQAEPNEDD